MTSTPSSSTIHRTATDVSSPPLYASTTRFAISHNPFVGSHIARSAPSMALRSGPPGTGVPGGGRLGHPALGEWQGPGGDSRHETPPVDVDDLTGDVRSLGRGEEGDHTGNVVRLGPAFEGDALYH